MRASRATGAWLVGIVLASVMLALRAKTGPDYILDAGPPMDALIHGRWHEFVNARPAMGPLSLLFRAPFAALSQLTGGGGPLDDYNNAYRFGVFPCVVASGVFGLLLERIMRHDGRPFIHRLVVVTLCVVNPVALRALHFGHPEEILGASLAIGGAVAAVYGRAGWMALLLGVAIANKQWALLVLLPAVLPVPWKDLRKPLAWLAGVALAIVVPILVTNPSAFVAVNRTQLDIRTELVQPVSIWWPFMPSAHSAQRPGYHALPSWLGVTARPLLLTVCLVVPLLLATRVRQRPKWRVLPLVALVLLLRCMLDPVNNGYYHEPFFVALVAADAVVGAFGATLVALGALEILTLIRASAAGLSAVYLTWSVPFAIYLAGRAYGVDWGALVRSRGARGRGAEPSPPPSAAGARSPAAR